MVAKVLSKYTTPDPERSVLLTIDVQRDFTDSGAVAEIAGTSGPLPAMQRLLHSSRLRRLPILHVVRLYLADGTNVDVCRREMIEGGESVVLPGTEGAELVACVQTQVGCLLRHTARKAVAGPGGYDRRCRGLQLPKFWPRATIYGASMRDFRTVLISDAVSGVYEQGLRSCAASQ
jgi:nicotinamidase-related amidase